MLPTKLSVVLFLIVVSSIAVSAAKSHTVCQFESEFIWNNNGTIETQVDNYGPLFEIFGGYGEKKILFEGLNKLIEIKSNFNPGLEAIRDVRFWGYPLSSECQFPGKLGSQAKCFFSTNGFNVSIVDKRTWQFNRFVWVSVPKVEISVGPHPEEPDHRIVFMKWFDNDVMYFRDQVKLTNCFWKEQAYIEVSQ